MQEKKNIKFLSGNEACGEGAIVAGCRFFGGYPISPSSEIAEFMSKRLPLVGGTFIQMEDEIASIGAILGASLAGVKSMTATSGPGLSLMQENIGFGAMAEIPTVIVDVMRGGPSTGNPTGPSQSDVMAIRWGTHGDYPAVALCPESVNEVFLLTIEAFNIAEFLRTPVVLAMDEITAHMREKVELLKESDVKIVNRKKPEKMPYLPYEYGEDLIPPLPGYGEGFRFHVTGLNHDKTGFPTNKSELMEEGNRRIMEKLDKNKDKVIKHEEFMTEDCDILVVAYGSSARAAKRAVRTAREKGIKAGLFRPITLYPLSEKALQKAAGKAKKVIVPEMNLGQYILIVERVIGHGFPIIGINQVDGEPISPSKILSKIEE
ncbi:MAG: 2-oxoacid:acceptor oxidoreductase subunit alpha [Thermoanaerobaculaceae bacterium]|nr:2-oxoacid:acceptor oxidoreductase subunit alpha [Thermoanaerobaculaceae bacterium]